MRAGLILPLLAGAAALAGQTMSARFLSEFRRVGASGEIVPADAMGTPREIISPALIRNGYTSFHLVAAGPPGAAFMLYIASNPDHVLRPTLYRVNGAAADRLEPVKGLSEAGKFNGHGVGVYWLDVWTPGATPVRRIRLEAQLNVGSGFVITPLELRVQPGVVPSREAPVAAIPSAGNSAAGPFALLDQSLCGGGGGTAIKARVGDPLSVLTKIMRNAGQDILLARQIEAAAANAKGWCTQARQADPEAYLRIRDAIWRASQ